MAEQFTKDFDDWHECQKRLEKKGPLEFKERDIFVCSVGANIGSEICGKPTDHQRPVVVVKKYSNGLFLGVPLSSKLKPDNEHAITVEVDGVKSMALLSQVRSMSSKRLLRKVGMMPLGYHADIRGKIVAYLSKR